METSISKIKSYFLAHKFLAVIMVILAVIVLIAAPSLITMLFYIILFFSRGGLGGFDNIFYCLGFFIYIGLVIWAAIHVHKINSGPKTEIASKYPATQTTWFWWIVITFSYMFCIFSYDSQSKFNIMSRLGGIFGLFTPIGPENVMIFSVILLIVVLIVFSKTEKRMRHIEKISARRKIIYILCVLFVLTFCIDLLGFITAFGSYNYFVKYTILNRSAYIDLRGFKNIQ